MKDVILPQKTDTTIGLGQLTPDFKGLIIGYYKDVPIGYIEYFEDKVLFLNNASDNSDVLEEGTTLLSLVTQLIEGAICTNFKVLEFEN